ncbi:MAG TPA: sigma-70 family RNA polymerase sigma factor, partial [Bryobacteraceae bacterium]|nr:sigma-70 family RNA polymerase sigma factor [Bryobacteraceae bacterium]
LQRSLQVISIEDLVTPPSVAPMGTDTMLFARLQRMVSQLSAREQDVIRMLYFEGRTVYHVASTLGISPGLVSRTHGVVLDKLRRLLLPTEPQLAKVA